MDGKDCPDREQYEKTILTLQAKIAGLEADLIRSREYALKMSEDNTRLQAENDEHGRKGDRTMRASVCHFNIYLTDRKWTLVDEFWSASNWGLAVGGTGEFAAGKLYDKPVRIKRMA